VVIRLKWSPDSRSIYFRTEDQGSAHICKVDLKGKVEYVTNGKMTVGSFSLDKTGTIIVRITLSIIAMGTGVIFCERFPNLSGEWDFFVHRKRCGKLHATENEFRGLQKPCESLGCHAGDRLMFTFNTWDRTVTLEKIGG